MPRESMTESRNAYLISVCVEVACSDRRDGHQRARAQLARKGHMGRLTLCIEHLPFPGRLWAIIDGDKFLRSTRSSHKCQFAAPRHCAIPRRACYVRSMRQGWHLSADNIWVENLAISGHSAPLTNAYSLPQLSTSSSSIF